MHKNKTKQQHTSETTKSSTTTNTQQKRPISTSKKHLTSIPNAHIININSQPPSVSVSSIIPPIHQSLSSSPPSQPSQLQSFSTLPSKHILQHFSSTPQQSSTKQTLPLFTISSASFNSSSPKFGPPSKRTKAFTVVLNPDSSFLDGSSKSAKKSHYDNNPSDIFSSNNEKSKRRSKNNDQDGSRRTNSKPKNDSKPYKKSSSSHRDYEDNNDQNTRKYNSNGDYKESNSRHWENKSYDYNNPQGKRNTDFIFNHKISNIQHQDPKKQLNQIGSNSSSFSSTSTTGSGQMIVGGDGRTKDVNVIKQHHGGHKIPNHPLGYHHQSLAQRKEREQEILTRLEQFQTDLNLYQAQLTAPLQDLILTQFSTLQRMALASKDSKASDKYSKASKKANVQMLENIGGGFHAIEDQTREFSHQRLQMDSNGRLIGVKPEIEALLEGNVDQQGYLKNQTGDLAGWALPGVDGVSKRITDIFSSRPQIDAKNLPIYLQQVIFTADKQLLASGKEKLQLLGKSSNLVQNAQKLLTSGDPGLYHGVDSNGKNITIEKTGDHRLIIHGLLDVEKDASSKSDNKVGSLQKIDPKLHKNSISIKFNHNNGDVMEIISLKDNLPIKDAFLPPMISMAPPSELIHSGALPDDTLLSVSISQKTLIKQFERKHLDAHKKEYYQLIDKHGQKDGDKMFWKQYPLNQRKFLPRESEVHAKFMTAIRGQHDLLKEAITSTGYGHIQQVESREKIIQSLLETANDDHELLILLKQSNVVHEDIHDLSAITIHDSKNQSIFKGKDALHRIIEHHEGQKGIGFLNKQYLDENSWLNSKESIVLPYSSPDGYSDAHLPALLRTAVKSIESTFTLMKSQCTPSATAYTNMMTLYGQLGLPARAATLFDEMVHDSDTVPDTTTYNVMLNILSKDGKTDLCLNLFDQMRQTAIDVVSHGKFPGLPPKHVEARKLHKLRTLISQKARAMGIDDVDFSGLVEMVKTDPNLKGTYLQGFDEKNKPSQDVIPRPDVITYTTVIKALGKAKHKTAALKLFHQMRTKDQIRPNELTWTTVIDIACDNNDFLAGLRLYHEMKKDGIKPSRATYSAMTTSAARGGEIALTTALLHEMMLQQQNNISLYGNSPNNFLIDAHFLGSVMRSSAEGGNASFALKLHSQLLRGQLTGSATMIGGGRFGKHENNQGNNKLPNAITYNALLEVLADPASWGRSLLPPAALRIGLAVYQEALLNKVFPHPYSEIQSTGILDLRQYNRGAVLFPIHFYLNSLLGEVPVYSIDGSVSNILNASTGTTTTNLDLAVSSITNRKAPSHVVGQSPYSIVAPDDNETTEVSDITVPSMSSPKEIIKFPNFTVPPKGVVFVSNKEIKPIWSAQPPVANVKLQQGEQQQKEQKYIPSVEYIENVLKHTKPWVHYTRLHYGAKGAEGAGGATTKKKTANNPNAVVVTANALRAWVHEQNNTKH